LTNSVTTMSITQLGIMTLNITIFSITKSVLLNIMPDNAYALTDLKDYGDYVLTDRPLLVP
jgi:hypothetical protein